MIEFFGKSAINLLTAFDAVIVGPIRKLKLVAKLSKMVKNYAETVLNNKLFRIVTYPIRKPIELAVGAVKYIGKKYPITKKIGNVFIKIFTSQLLSEALTVLGVGLTVGLTIAALAAGTGGVAPVVVAVAAFTITTASVAISMGFQIAKTRETRKLNNEKKGLEDHLKTKGLIREKLKSIGLEETLYKDTKAYSEREANAKKSFFVKNSKVHKLADSNLSKTNSILIFGFLGVPKNMHPLLISGVVLASGMVNPAWLAVQVGVQCVSSTIGYSSSLYAAYDNKVRQDTLIKTIDEIRDIDDVVGYDNLKELYKSNRELEAELVALEGVELVMKYNPPTEKGPAELKEFVKRMFKQFKKDALKEQKVARTAVIKDLFIDTVKTFHPFKEYSLGDDKELRAIRKKYQTTSPVAAGIAVVGMAIGGDISPVVALTSTVVPSLAGIGFEEVGNKERVHPGKPKDIELTAKKDVIDMKKSSKLSIVHGRGLVKEVSKTNKRLKKKIIKQAKGIISAKIKVKFDSKDKRNKPSKHIKVKGRAVY